MKVEKNPGNLYLIPSTLGSEDIETYWPSKNTDIISNLDGFIVENLRTARRFLRTVGYSKSFDEAKLYVLNKHTKLEDIATFLHWCLEGNDMGLLSEAGCPCIADPGQVVVRMAHENGINVYPLVGPSSIMLALMSSGFNGQNFAFAGYLPIDKRERAKSLKHLENLARKENQSQIFMETPFRNNQMLQTLLETLDSETQLCVACDITMKTQLIKTKKVGEWKKQMPDLNKRPSIFIISVS